MLNAGRILATSAVDAARLWKQFRPAFVASLVLGVAPTGPAAAQAGNPQPGMGMGFGFPTISGMTEFGQRCGNCHTEEGLELDGRIAMPLSALRTSTPALIYSSMNSGGRMEIEAAGLSDEQKRDIAEYLTSRTLVDVERTGISAMKNLCESNPPLAEISGSPSWNGWSPSSNNARFQTAGEAGLSAEDVPNLELKWAFGLPDGSSSLSQPSVVFGRVFVGSDNAAVYSMDAQTGCVYWAFHGDAPGRFSPIIAPIQGHAGSSYAVFFVTRPGTAYAVDAHDGTLIWQTQLEGLHAVSASSAYSNGRLYVPFTGTETMSGRNLDYECCRSRGGVAALDTNTGQVVWYVDSLPEPLEKLGVNGAGTQLWGPAGASIWNTPTVDSNRDRIYVGTGNNYGPIASSTSDSILALSMEDGRILWSHQEFEGDSFMVGCGPTNPPGGNCPEVRGPDWDFGGGSVILQQLADGRDILVAAGKGGVALALDPDDEGKVLWRTVLYEDSPPGPQGLVLFGGAADGERVYFPLQRPGGGLKALWLESGAIAWSADLETGPRGQTGPASAIPGVVFTGAWDGVLRAVSDDTGEVIWSFDTRQDFETVNGITASGGSLGSAGAVIVDGMLFVSSGYRTVLMGSPGNVVLAFAVQ